MKKIIGIGIAAMMVMGLAAAANAATATDLDWVFNIKASHVADFSAAATTSVIGAQTGKNNYYLATEDTMVSETISGTPAYAYAYSSQLQQDGTTVKQLTTDKRLSLSDTNPVIRWVIKLGTYNFDGLSGHPQAVTGLYVRFFNPKDPSFGAKLNRFAPLTPAAEHIRVYRWDGQNKVGAALFDLTGASTSADGANFDTGLLSMDTQLLVEATVPEPGSIVAMMSGLVGLAGFAIRRRK